jgi:hypothetical protein
MKQINAFLAVDVKTYNALLDVTFFLRDSAEKRWELIQVITHTVYIRIASAAVFVELKPHFSLLFVIAACSLQVCL